MMEITVLRKELHTTEENITLIKDRIEDIHLMKEFTELRFNELIESELNTLIELLISKIIVHPEYIHFDAYFSEFFEEGDKKYAS
ncbi:hypothetical protein [Bacillus sp. 1P06AnD]|uniref:hypothetical protein n=1 Tax=Bacillus sp. 1P06AnD TaxID=3132208 RepID=UPI0039A30735